MKYVIGAIVGLLWGALVAWLNSRINKKAIGNGTAASLGLLTVFFAFQLSKPEPEKKPDESVQPEKTESRGEETK